MSVSQSFCPPLDASLTRFLATQTQERSPKWVREGRKFRKGKWANKWTEIGRANLSTATAIAFAAASNV